MAKRQGETAIILENDVRIVSFAAVVGPKEAEGPLSRYFDKKESDEMLGEKSFEKAESKFQQKAVDEAFKKGGFKRQDMDVIFAGDLLNQCIGSSYGLRDFDIPFVGLYGACSTMVLSLVSAALSIEGGWAKRAVAVTSSHFCSSERQFRFPLEYGGQRPPTAQWTVTGAGAAVVQEKVGKIKVKAAAIGKIVDFGITDMGNMGAAMAPAAWDTISAFLKSTNTQPSDYDLILTGDLGFTGSELLVQIAKKDNVDLSNHNDCGMMIFDREGQDVHSGGSGCGCCGSVLCSYVLQQMEQGNLKNILVCATGALMSTTSTQQGESIPSIAHLVHLSVE
ncbi:MAG: stage V sporulation protein AD [Ruminococcaceae bacterium]|nr:stage V sporulation protein AD [Oscillospiraceae bacterium]